MKRSSPADVRAPEGAPPQSVNAAPWGFEFCPHAVPKSFSSEVQVD